VLHVVVRGRVQGVGFRWFVRERGRALGLSGWVRNLADGSVEVAANGERRALERLRVLVGQGPPGADVSAVNELSGIVDPAPAAPFTILR
jgi:acylphosphatase